MKKKIVVFFLVLFWLVIGFFGTGMSVYYEHSKSPSFYLPEKPSDLLNRCYFMTAGPMTIFVMGNRYLGKFLDHEKIHFGFKNPLVVYKKQA